MAMRFINPPDPILNQTISGSAAVQSSPLYLGGMASACAAWIVNVGSGLTAYFNLLISQDGLNWYDSGQVIPSVSGNPMIFPVEYGGAFPWVLIQVTPTSGSGSVVVSGFAKGAA